MARHNIGTIAGGAWVWDDTAHLPWEALYSSNLTALRLPPELDLRDATLPNGVSIRVETPTMAYRLGYDDPGRFSADLRFDAVLPPRPLTAGGSTFGHSAHFDQIGRITGTVQLHGEDIDIDCWSMRDRTWGRRPEDRPRQAAYVTGAGEGGSGFLAVTNTRDGHDRVAYGFVQRGDAQVGLVDGERRVRRSADGWIADIRIDAVDAAGERFAVVGTPLSRIIIKPPQLHRHQQPHSLGRRRGGHLVGRRSGHVAVTPVRCGQAHRRLVDRRQHAMSFETDVLLVRLASQVRNDIAPSIDDEYARTQAHMTAVILERLARQAAFGDGHRAAGAC